jgi:hypothetical protein
MNSTKPNSHDEYDLKAIRSLQRAVRKVYEERAKQNETVSIWRDGKIVTLPAAELLKESEQTTAQN